jgi:putative ABC transport system substrate-binding protein
MNRKLYWLLTAILLVLTHQADAQQTKKVPRIGYLGNSSATVEPDLLGAFRQGLRDLGYIEDQNIVIEYRWADGKYDRFPDFVADLLRLNVAVIIAAGTPGILAAKRATKTIPIVMAVAGDAVGAGLVDSLARPGGNVTGLTTLAGELEGKRLELLKETVPNLSRVAVLLNPANSFTALAWKETQVGAEALRLSFEPVEVKAIEEFKIAFAGIAKQRLGGLVMLADRFLLANRARVLDFVAQRRLPVMYPYQEFVDDGGLMSYGPSYTNMYRRAATYVDKILKGANPADLPVEQPTKFELLINLKAAKQIGLTIPPTVLAQADRVIR